MAAPWSRVVNSTINDYSREREINVLRNRKLSALLQKKGRISYNHSGIKYDWKVQFKRVKPSPYESGDGVDFSQKDRHKTAQIDWRGYSSGDSITKKEILMNRGKEAIIKIFSTMAEMLMDDAEDNFGEEFYLNGNAAGNEKRLQGIETFMAAAQNAGNGGASPTSTNYAGLSCVPGAAGGSWSSPAPYANLTNNGWPNGKGDTQFDYWSPIIVDYGDTIFPGGATSGQQNWKYNCEEAISYGIIKAKKSKSKRGSLDVIMSDEEMYRLLIARMRSKQRIIVNRGAGESDLVALGFTDVINMDGTDFTWEYGIPTSVAYGWNFSNMELMSLQDRIWVPTGPQEDINTKSHKVALDFFGNLWFNPKFFVKWQNYTNTSSPLAG